MTSPKVVGLRKDQHFFPLLNIFFLGGSTLGVILMTFFSLTDFSRKDLTEFFKFDQKLWEMPFLLALLRNFLAAVQKFHQYSCYEDSLSTFLTVGYKIFVANKRNHYSSILL